MQTTKIAPDQSTFMTDAILHHADHQRKRKEGKKRNREELIQSSFGPQTPRFCLLCHTFMSYITTNASYRSIACFHKFVWSRPRWPLRAQVVSKLFPTFWPIWLVFAFFLSHFGFHGTDKNSGLTIHPWISGTLLCLKFLYWST